MSDRYQENEPHILLFKTKMSSFLIKNVIIADGTGTEPFAGAVRTDSGVITDVYSEKNAYPAADKHCYTLDGRGLMLCPGFIDAHGHSDLSLHAAPDAYGKISQGITTEINGNCGLSPFPVTDANREHLEELYASYNVPLSWTSFAGYAEALSRREPAINTFSLCGHNTLRAAVCGYGKTEPDSKQLASMCDLFRNCLAEGAGGFSTGLLYIPGKFASQEELVALLGVLREFHRPYTTHLRSEGLYLIEALEEAINCSQQAKIPRLHISHLKTAGAGNWHKLEQVLAMIGKAQASGLNITADRYPYIESMTQLSVILPSPYDDLDDVSLLRRLQDDGERQKLRTALDSFAPERWSNTRLISTSLAAFRHFPGLNLQEIADRCNLAPQQVCIDLLAGDAPGTMAAFRGMSRDNLEKILRQPFICCGTDETARPQNYHIGRSHPRGFGSFPEFFRQLSPDLKPEQIIHKMTMLPATIFGLRNRGRIASGCAADLVLIDPDKFCAGASFSAPHVPAIGIHHVFVNGALSFSGGTVINRNGKVLSPAKDIF